MKQMIWSTSGASMMLCVMLFTGCGADSAEDGVGWDVAGDDRDGALQEPVGAPADQEPVIVAEEEPRVEVPVEHDLVVEPEMAPLVTLEDAPAGECEFTGEAHAHPVDGRAGKVCLQEVYGEQGCLSTQLRFAYDAQGRAWREDSRVHSLDFRIEACGPYADLPSPYRKKRDFIGDSNTLASETVYASPDDETPQTRTHREYDAQGRMTYHEEEYHAPEQGWTRSGWERWSFGEGGAVTEHEQGWGESDEGTFERFERDERARVLAKFVSYQGEPEWVSQRNGWGDSAETPEWTKTFDKAGEVASTITNTREEIERDGELWEVLTNRSEYGHGAYEQQIWRVVREDVQVIETLHYAWRANGERVLTQAARQTVTDGEVTHEARSQGGEWWLARHERFDSAGRLIEETSWGSTGMQRAHVEKIWTSWGAPVEERHDWTGDGQADSCLTWTYDTYGNVLQAATDDRCDGSPESVTQNSYDSAGRLVQTVADWDGDGVIDQRYEQRFGCE